jgi:tetratricopeptide (TPR) repeat protein
LIFAEKLALDNVVFAGVLTYKQDRTVMRGKIWLASCVALASLYGQQAQIGTFANIRPGTSLKAEVDLNLGEALKKVDENVFEYPAPRGVTDTARVVAGFFADSRQVSRLEVYLKRPLDPEVLRPQFGTRVMVREREGGVTEEFYYPKLNSLILAKNGGAATAIAIGYLSPRLMADLLVERAQELRGERRLDEAQTEADKAVLVDPDYARGYLEQGDCWADLKNETEAIVSFIAGGNAKYSARYRALAHTRLGSLYWRSRNWLDKAPVEFQKALALAPALDEAHLRYGEFLWAQKQADPAVAELSQAIRLNPRNVQAHQVLGSLYYSRSDFAQALPHYAFVSAWAETPASSNNDAAKAAWHYRYAICLGRERKSPEAIEALRKAVQRDPGMIAAWHQLGAEYQVAKEIPKALDAYRSGLKVNSQDFALNQGLGNALLESGQTEAARRQIEQTLRLRPDDAAQRFYMARCWAALGKKKEAIYWIQQAVSGGFKDRSRLVGDHFLAPLQSNGEFKKILQQVS